MWTEAEAETDKLVIGISACLAGQPVRYDGADKKQSLLISILSPHAELRAFCPEVAAGLGIPRPPVRLVETAPGQLAARGVDNPDLDVSRALSATAERYVGEQLEQLNGFVFKSRSPSCGFGSAPVTDAAGRLLRHGDGVFAGEIRTAAHWLPAMEEGWFETEARCYRFLSACALVTGRHGRLEELLRSGAPDESVAEIVDWLLRPDGEEEEAAWSRRLGDYWRGRVPG